MRATNLIPYSLLLILAGAFILYVRSDNLRDSQFTRKVYEVGYQAGRLNQALRMIHPGHDFEGQFRVDSMEIERQIKEYYKN